MLEASEAIISEGTVYEYLGMLVSQDRYSFHQQESLVLKKMRSEGETLLHMFPQAPGKVQLQDLVWRQVVSPALTYGAEIQTPTPSLLKEMEALQRDLGRRILRGHANPAAPSVSGDLGWLDPKMIFHTRSMTFWGRLLNMPQDRLVGRVFKVFQNVSPPLPWFQYVQQTLDEYGIKQDDLTSRGKEALKNFVKAKVKNEIIRQWKEKAKAKSTLRYMAKGHSPSLGRFLDGSSSGYWMHRVRTDTLLVNSRRFPKGSAEERSCPFCRGKKETLEHLLIHCPYHKEVREKYFPILSEKVHLDMNKASDEELMEIILGFHPMINDNEYRTQRKFLMEIITNRGIPFYSKE